MPIPLTQLFDHRIVNEIADPAMPGIRRIYESEFPECERKPTDCLNPMLERADYKMIVAQAKDAVIGFAILFVPANPNDAALLEYLAIDPQYQGAGVGTELVRAAMDYAHNRPLLAEVESSPEPPADRRRTFYRRLGFRQLMGLPYLLPLPNAPPMELMLINGPTDLDREILTRWLRCIYQSVYGCGSNDYRLTTMLAQLPPKI